MDPSKIIAQLKEGKSVQSDDMEFRIVGDGASSNQTIFEMIIKNRIIHDFRYYLTYSFPQEHFYQVTFDNGTLKSLSGESLERYILNTLESKKSIIISPIRIVLDTNSDGEYLRFWGTDRKTYMDARERFVIEKDNLETVLKNLLGENKGVFSNRWMKEPPKRLTIEGMINSLKKHYQQCPGSPKSGEPCPKSG